MNSLQGKTEHALSVDGCHIRDSRPHGKCCVLVWDIPCYEPERATAKSLVRIQPTCSHGKLAHSADSPAVVALDEGSHASNTVFSKTIVVF